MSFWLCTRMIAKSYWLAASPELPPSTVHCGEVATWSAHQVPNGASSDSGARLPPLDAPELL